MDKLIDALLKSQIAIQHAAGSATNPHFHSKYATYEGVVAAVKPILNKNGIYFQQVSHPTPDGVSVETVFHGYDDVLTSGVLFVPAAMSKNGAGPQQFGAALTYARRYSLALACGIGTNRDDDANAAQEAFESSERWTLKNSTGPIAECDGPNEFLLAAIRHVGGARKETPEARDIYTASIEEFKKLPGLLSEEDKGVAQSINNFFQKEAAE
tara:strand:+ start:3403 stop:4038 length:636 start_codon:yes stop_codon:yes gene_type:complete